MTPDQAAMQATISENKGWFYFLGILLVILGIAAVAFPFVTTIAAKVFLGWLFLIAGIVQVFHAFSTRTWSAFFLDLLIGVLYVIAGAWLAFFPLTGIITLTFLLAVMFILHGVLQGTIALNIRPYVGWIWMLLAGIVGVVVGVLLILKLPSSATWAIGLLVGTNLIMSGVAFLFLPNAAKDA